MHTSLRGGITDLLLDEDSYVALHNRMLQLALPTAVNAISPDSVILVMHALGTYIKMVMESCPQASMPVPIMSLQDQAKKVPRQSIFGAGDGGGGGGGRGVNLEPEWETVESDKALYARLAREQVAAARAQAQRRAALALQVEEEAAIAAASRRKRKRNPPLFVMKPRFTLPAAAPADKDVSGSPSGNGTEGSPNNSTGLGDVQVELGGA